MRLGVTASLFPESVTHPPTRPFPDAQRRKFVRSGVRRQPHGAAERRRAWFSPTRLPFGRLAFLRHHAATRALSDVFGIRDLVCLGGQDSTATGSKQLAMQSPECLGPPIIGPQPQNQISAVLDDSLSLSTELDGESCSDVQAVRWTKRQAVDFRS